MSKKWNFADVLDFDKKAFERSDFIKDASQVLLDGYKELAPAEALFRATMSERLEAPDEAGFWVDVYISLSKLRAEKSDD